MYALAFHGDVVVGLGGAPGPVRSGVSSWNGLWQSEAVRRRRRDEGPTPSGAAYSVTNWDDETGDADIVEYDERGRIVCRHEWRIFGGLAVASDVVGEMVTFDAEGRETRRRPLRSSGFPCSGSGVRPTSG
jgi:hypothetical protein